MANRGRKNLDQNGSFTDTAALIVNMNLIITADTAISHLAGALGVKVWTVLKKKPDWRWMLDREDTPWYSSMRLFRQNETRDWSGVFSQVRSELEQYTVDNVVEGRR